MKQSNYRRSDAALRVPFLFLCMSVFSCASLHEAIDAGNETEVRRIVEGDRTLLEKPVGGFGNHRHFWSPLNYSLVSDKLGIADLLLSLGAPVNQPVGKLDSPALDVCFQFQKPIAFCGRLFEKANLSKAYLNGERGAQLLLAAQDEKSAHYLLDHGVSADARTVDGTNALFFQTDPKIVALLLERGARADILGFGNSTALHVACDRDRRLFSTAEHALNERQQERRSAIRILYRARPESMKLTNKEYKTPADLSDYCAALANATPAKPGFTDTVLLKNGETLTNVKATVTRDAVIVADSTGNTRTIPKEQIAGVKTGEN